jgi:hypothetical protein
VLDRADRQAQRPAHRSESVGDTGYDPRRIKEMRSSDMSDVPQTDDRHPADVVTAMVDQVLKLAETWTTWNGEPRPASNARNLWMRVGRRTLPASPCEGIE